jgi:aspartate aminotransferase-like enzyme
VSATDKILFTPGPVMMDPEIIKTAAVQIPYSRTADFSQLVLRAEAAMISLLNAPEGSRVVFITGSGTAAMEAAVLNFIHPGESVAVVDGGTFGHRFVEICERHQVPVQRLQIDRDPLTDGTVLAQVRPPVAALLINGHETSIGHLYDLAATAEFTSSHDALHVVDAIGMFGTDKIDMAESKIDVLIASSNKGLALAPGISILVMSPRALSRLVETPRSYYLDVRAMLTDGLRGQTPFTPAIGVFLQLDVRLSKLSRQALDTGCEHARRMATYFRDDVAGLPLRFYSRHLPNALTPLELSCEAMTAREIVDRLDRDYGLLVAPNAGALADKVFRVSHMGNLKMSDFDMLLSALREILSST